MPLHPDVILATFLLVNSDAFRKLRKRFGLTQAQLARQLGVHRVTVTNWERGVAKVPGPVVRLMRRFEAERKQ